MANARGKTIDNTHLSIDTAEERGLIHRDYIAHCFRWSYVVKQLYKKSAYKDAIIYDVGCGKEMPLMKLLYSNKLIPLQYCAIDYNKLEIPEMLKKDRLSKVIHTYPNVDFAETRWNSEIYKINSPSHVVCFEVLEHVELDHACRMLRKMAAISDANTNIFISTPVFNGKAAANHVNEMTIPCLSRIIANSGLKIVDRFGTFASQAEIEPKLEAYYEKSKMFLETYRNLKNYYDTNVLSTIFAPLFPDASRNNLWHLRLADNFLYCPDKSLYCTDKLDSKKPQNFYTSSKNVNWEWLIKEGYAE